MSDRLVQILNRAQRNMVPDPHSPDDGCRECDDARDIEALVTFAISVKSFVYRSPNGHDPAYDDIRDLLNDLDDAP